jgi:hypothetical protein
MSEIIPSTPVNTNLFHANKFALSFATLPNVQYFCQGIPLPGVSMGEGLFPTPYVDLYVPGDKIQYDSLAITFLVDEELRSWIEVHNWIRGMTYPVELVEYSRLKQRAPNVSQVTPQFSDASLVILDSNQNSLYRVDFKNCFPTSLSAIQFSTTGQGPGDVMTADATFRFDYYNIVSTR